MPELSRNLLSNRKGTEEWGNLLIYYKTKAVLGFLGEELLVFDFCPRKELVSTTGVRRIPGQGTALAVAAKARDVMDVHHMFAHPNEEITRISANVMTVIPTDGWGPCEACSQAKAKRYAMPKMTDKRANVKEKQFYVDVGGPMKHSSFRGNNYVIIFVDDCTRLKVVKFVKNKSDTTAAHLS